VSSSTRRAVADRYFSGIKPSEIARQLRLAPTTVGYHIQRILRDDDQAPVTEPAPAPAHFHVKTREAVAQLLAEGHAKVEVARRLGVSKATVSYHVRRLGKPTDDRFGRRYDWEAVQRFYDAGHSVRDCVKAFGFSQASWSEAVKRGAVIARPSATPIAELLVAGTYRGRENLKLRLVKEGLKENRCERCGLGEWRGEPLSVALHHVNGDRLDNRLENLELLCPFCHSLTNTFSGRNGHRRQASG
jgi:DNA-binding CsgD family transcriptional regulator